LSPVEVPTARAELYIIKIPVEQDRREILPGGDLVRVNPGSAQVNRFVGWLQRAGIGAGLRLVVPPAHAGQMLTTFQGVMITFIWAATVVGTLAITVYARLSGSAILGILGLELGGLVVTLIAARRRRANY
jgi:hypothetical protein